MMVRALNVIISAFLFLAIFCPITSAETAKTTSTMIGSPTINFSLASTQDRLISYGQEYYGRYNLIITFFPAAFTPV
jgi:hypothetical protein